jgi:uncharacterized protein YndB with AHSA1/START domain
MNWLAIGSATFAALSVTAPPAAAEERPPLTQHAVIGAPVAAVWKAWSTKEGWEAWNVAHCELDLRVGGLIRSTYDPNGKIGDAGTIENTILCFDPERMLAIRNTKAPERFPFKEAFSQVWTIVYFEPLDAKRTKVLIRGLNYPTDAQGQQLRAFFDQGNKQTLAKLQEYLARPAAAK